MIIKKLLLICLIVCCTSVQCQVVQLTSKNISQYLNDHVTFVRFYAHWCPHSKKFESVWTNFARTKENSDVHVAEVDCSDEGLLCSDHDVFGYPTVKLFVRGSGARYEGPRDIMSLEAFYQERINEDTHLDDNLAATVAVLELTADNFASMTSQGFAFVVFFAPWCKHCQVLKPVFQELARQMSNTPGLIFATVDCTLHNSLCGKNAVRGYPTLIWFENGSEKDRYNDARNIHTMQHYIEDKMKESIPTTTITMTTTTKPPTLHKPVENAAYIENVLTPTTFTKGVSFEGYAFVNFGAPWCSHCQKLAPIWTRLGQHFASNEEIRIARVDCTASESLCRDHGIRAFPSLILFRYGESKVEFSGSRDFDSMLNFLVSQLEYFGDEYLLHLEENEILTD